ncbi:MAG: DUF6465 family protein [Anaeromassilibacillus sp.]|nr:DUF6465 family protein [Anaeromassilibacillus sp.]MDY3779165.1 DUF6465 family protein [Candidatus Limousia pullorum]
MATTKKTAPEAAKTETAKVEAVKAEEAVAETVTAADTKVEEVAAAPAKALAKKTTKKAATKKTTTKKAAAKKEEAVEVAAPAATTEIFVEYNGVQVSGEEIVRLVKGSYGKDVTDLKIYVKPEDNRAYYVADGEAGSVRVLFI